MRTSRENGGGTSYEQLVRIGGLRGAYDERQILRDIDLTAAPGTIAVLAAPDSTGKLTLAETSDSYPTRDVGEVAALCRDPAQSSQG